MTDTLEQRTYERGMVQCAVCGCLRRRSWLVATVVQEGATVRVAYQCPEPDFCALAKAVREAGARKEMQG